MAPKRSKSPIPFNLKPEKPAHPDAPMPDYPDLTINVGRQPAANQPAPADASSLAPGDATVTASKSSKPASGGAADKSKLQAPKLQEMTSLESLRGVVLRQQGPWGDSALQELDKPWESANKYKVAGKEYSSIYFF